jgi:ureidoacrylate peracid hydrolase
MNLSDKIKPLHTALIVIDIQNDFCSPDGALAQRGRDLSLMDPMIDSLQKTINVAERKAIPVLYTQQIYDRAHLNSLQLEQYDLDSKFISCDIATDGWKFYRLNPRADKVYVKYNYNIFSNSELVTKLQSLSIKTLVLTGVDTYICVETAIRNGFDLGYKIVVPIDLVAVNAKHRALQERTFDLVRKTYGTLTTSQELITMWNSYD